MKKQLKLLVLLVPLVLILSGCSSTEPITTDPSGIWEWLVYVLALLIVKLGQIFGNNIGWGLVLATLIVRIAMIPLYKTQIKSSEAMTKIQPELKKLQEKYKNVARDDREGQMRQQQEMSALYKRYNVSPLSGCLPMLIQMPVLFAFYGAIRGLLINGMYSQPVQAANQGLLNLTGGVEMNSKFLGFELGERVILFAILAAVTTWASTKLSMMGAPKTEGAAADVSNSMLKVMPIMILFMGWSLPGALSIYWVVGNLVTLGQTLYFKRETIFNKKRSEVVEPTKDPEFKSIFDDKKKK